MQLSRRHLEGSRRQAAPHIFALGPPTSEMEPPRGMAAMRFASSRMDASERGRRCGGPDGGPVSRTSTRPAAAMGGDARGDHFHRRDRFLVGRMRTPRERQGVQAVQFFGGQGRGRRHEEDRAVAVGLREDAAGLVGLALKPDGPVQIGAGHGNISSCEGRSGSSRPSSSSASEGNGGCFDEPAVPGIPAQRSGHSSPSTGSSTDRSPTSSATASSRRATSRRARSPMPQEGCPAGRRTGWNGAGYRPKIVMGDAAERGFDASGGQGQAGECLADQPRVDDDGAVGARSGFAAGRVGVIVAFLRNAV